jgi:hypothetical protein
MSSNSLSASGSDRYLHATLIDILRSYWGSAGGNMPPRRSGTRAKSGRRTPSEQNETETASCFASHMPSNRHNCAFPS